MSQARGGMGVPPRVAYAAVAACLWAVSGGGEALAQPLPQPQRRLQTAPAARLPLPKGGPVKAPGLPAAPTLSAQEYDALLGATEGTLEGMVKRGPRSVHGALKPLINKRQIRRADGELRQADGSMWSDIAQINGGPAATNTGAQVEKALVSVRTARKALREWAIPAGGNYYQATDAQAIVRQLESTGQIKTQPSALEKFAAGAREAIANLWQAFSDWLAGLFPSRAPSAPKMDFNWFWPLMWALLISCLLLAAWYIVRSLELKWGRKGSAGGTVLDDEDAALLLLPPDELRQRARQFAAQGRFREALRHRFLGLILELDQRGVWRYDPRRTNWEHIDALRDSPEHRALKRSLSSLARRFDVVRYGGVQCSAAEWERFDGDAQALESQLGVPAAAAVGAATQREGGRS